MAIPGLPAASGDGYSGLFRGLFRGQLPSIALDAPLPSRYGAACAQHAPSCREGLVLPRPKGARQERWPN